MRTLAVAAITSLIALALATTATAAPTVSLNWGAFDGATDIASSAGDTITVYITVTPDGTGVSAAGLQLETGVAGTVSVFYDPVFDGINDGGGSTFTPAASATYGGAGLTLIGGVACTNAAGTTGNFAEGFCGNNFQGKLGSVAANGTLVGTFAHAGTGINTLPYTIGVASFVVVPEPATAGLLALGLGALALISRRR